MSMRKVFSIALVVILSACLFSCSTNLGRGYATRFGRPVIEITEDSMSPTLSAGDKIICKKVTDPHTLKKGNIIAFWTVIDGQRVICVHRIHEIYDGGNYLLFSTKGDNNTEVDALTVHESEIIGKYVRKAIF